MPAEQNSIPLRSYVDEKIDLEMHKNPLKNYGKERISSCQSMAVFKEKSPVIISIL